MSNTAIFNYPNITGLARHLAKEFGQAGEVAEPTEAVEVSLPRSIETEEEGIAIVGMACRFPGTDDLSAYWRLLETGQNTVTDGRPRRRRMAGSSRRPGCG